ncbi:MAG TPA: alpha/beta hydrolase [Caulobacteraceae bacterium]|jgi:acetyl esterase|nr:alpha/beta hydrolase [Caulobacteraceae bacterium]
MTLADKPATERGTVVFEPPVERMVERFEANMARPFRAEDLPAIRERFSRMAAATALAEGVTMQDVGVRGVPVRLYRPTAMASLPLHLHLHGGGFILGSALSGAHDGVLSRRAAATGALVASVEYRKAPEHPFPAGIEDSYAALAGLVENAEDFSVEPRAVSLGGVSSGGNFAAVLALMVRDRGGPPLILQLLEIAGTDLTKSSSAWRNFRRGHDTTRERDLAMVDLYLPDLQSRADPYASPLFARDLSGLPAAWVMNAEHDPRRDECEAYVARLQDAGVEAVASTQAGHVHGSMSLPDWAPARAWEAEANRVLAAANAAALDGRAVRFGGT